LRQLSLVVFAFISPLTNFRFDSCFGPVFLSLSLSLYLSLGSFSTDFGSLLAFGDLVIENVQLKGDRGTEGKGSVCRRMWPPRPFAPLMLGKLGKRVTKWQQLGIGHSPEEVGSLEL